MKKITRMLGMACLVGLMAFSASCKKNDETKGSSVNLIMPQMTTVNIDGDRAYINEDGQFIWKANDKIKVYNLSFSDPTQSVSSIFTNVTGEGEYATFQGEGVGPRLDKYFYFYPVKMAIGDDETWLADENRELFEVSDTQHFHFYDQNGHTISMVDPDAMPLAINTNDITANATLKQMFGVAAILLKTNTGNHKVVTSVTITDKAYNLTGTCSLKLPAVDTLELQALMEEYRNYDPSFAAHYANYIIDELGWESTPTGNTITMDCTNPKDGLAGVPLANTLGQFSSFNFLLRPLALSGGFDVLVTFEDGTTFPITKWNENNPRKHDFFMEPGIIKTFTWGSAIR